VAIFEDDPARAHVRLEQRDAHFAYLARNAARIRIGGGLRQGPDEPWIGGLWVIDTESRDEAVRLCEDDPFFQEGLRKSYRIMSWGRAPCYGAVTL
jgi:uncharacterized protein YciI